MKSIEAAEAIQNIALQAMLSIQEIYKQTNLEISNNSNAFNDLKTSKEVIIKETITQEDPRFQLFNNSNISNSSNSSNDSIVKPTLQSLKDRDIKVDESLNNLIL